MSFVFNGYVGNDRPTPGRWRDCVRVSLASRTALARVWASAPTFGLLRGIHPCAWQALRRKVKGQRAEAGRWQLARAREKAKCKVQKAKVEQMPSPRGERKILAHGASHASET
jgi:hypothetical protein